MKRSTKPKIFAYERPWILRQQALLDGVREGRPIYERQAVRQEFFREIEFAMTKHVAINVPTDTLGHFHAPGIACGIDVRL